MKLQILRKNLASTIIVSIVLILLLFSFIGFVIVRDLSLSVKENKIRFERADKSNDEYLSEIEFKGELSRIIKDVNYTTLLTLEFLESSEKERMSKSEKVWLKRILPSLDTLDSHVGKSTSDFTKVNFNSIYDEINNNKFYQDKIQENLGADTSEVGKYLKELKRSTERLTESYSSFLSSKPEQNIITFKPVSPLEENLVGKMVFTIIVFALILFIINFLISFLSKPLVEINKFLSELRGGDFPNKLDLLLEDYKNISQNLNGIKEKFEVINDFARSVSANNYEGQKSLSFDREGELGKSLVEMQTSLEATAIQDKQRNHINQGLARFSEVLSNYTNNLEEFGDVVLKELVNFLKANQGAFYVALDGDVEIKMVSCYAYDKKKHLDVHLKNGQGLVGQVFLEAKPIYLTEVPEKYVTITSGLGESTPRSILIVPLIFNEQVQGVIELASFNLLEEYEQGFVQKVTESISAALASVKVNTKTQKLLKESSDLTEQMRSQEDLMLSKVEELNKSQEETRQREISYIKEINRLKRKIEKYEYNL